ncbi:hypothetical protein F5X68DRAFT_50938 [Plectosphaerella plurivora]|uniref:Uncharacterized protein n=1 Tax=Plectosphaerella plurivora TaxID=936078 RepID=A0A9P9A604_9PEZI|nr:hypothetical protein F5X68DRAFT_50938 [Plectosphaerella plurivora]
MSRLLQLPRELRDEILSLVAFTPVKPPDSPQTLRHDESKYRPLGVRGTQGGHPQLDFSSVACTQSSPYGAVNTTLALLLTNRQLHAETLELLSTNPQSKTCEVDIMDADFGGPRAWVTWLCVPCKLSEVDTLIINIRLFDKYPVDQPPPETYTHKRFLHANMSLSYRLLLASILQNGPGAFNVTRLDYEAAFFVRRLIFNFHESSIPPLLNIEHPKGCLRPSDPALIEPSAEGLHKWLTDFQRGDQDYQDGRIIHQGVGEMEIRVGNELRHSIINVTDAFCRLPNADSLWPLNLFEHRWEFERWVHGTIEKRKRWGLWDDSVQQKLTEDGEPECGLLIPGLWWSFIGDDWRTTGQLPMARQAFPFSTEGQ